MPFARYWRSASECAGAHSVDCIRFLLPDASRHCEERGDVQLFPAGLDCFASLEMTVSNLQPFGMGPSMRVRSINFGYSEINVKAYFGKSELLSFLKFRNMAICWMSK